MEKVSGVSSVNMKNEPDIFFGTHDEDSPAADQGNNYPKELGTGWMTAGESFLGELIAVEISYAFISAAS